jgi:hypothetical protein
LMLPIPFGNLENSRILGTLGDAPTSEQHSGIHYPHTIYVLHIYLRQMAYSVLNTLNILKEIISPASWALTRFPLVTINQGEPRVTHFPPSILRLLLAPGGLVPEGKPRFRWSVYILYATRFVIGRLGFRYPGQ